MKYRLAAVLPAHIVVFAVCLYSALLLRFDFVVPPHYLSVFFSSLPLVMLVKGLACLATGEWRRTYRYASLSDAVSLAEMTLWATAAVWLCNYWWFTPPLPRSVVLIDAILSLVVLASLRVAVRAHAEVIRPRMHSQPKETALIYGVRQDSIGILKMLRALTSQQSNEPSVIGFVGHDAPRDRSLIDGLPIFREEDGWNSHHR